HQSWRGSMGAPQLAQRRCWPAPAASAAAPAGAGGCCWAPGAAGGSASDVDTAAILPAPGARPRTLTRPRAGGRARARARAPLARVRWTARDDVAAGGREPLVELQLPVVAGERPPRAELAHVALDRLTGGHRHAQLRVGAARQGGVRGRREGAAEARV